jgi:excisionase family DNA binding protein
MKWEHGLFGMDEITLGEAADLLGLSPRQVSDLVDTGVLPARITSSAVRISLADLEIYRVRSTPAPLG